MASVVYEMIGRLFSRVQMRKLGGLLEAAGVDFVPEAFAGFMVVTGAVLSLLAYFLLSSFAETRGLLYRLSAFLWPDVAASSPDFFILVSSIVSIILASCSFPTSGCCCALTAGAGTSRRCFPISSRSRPRT